MDQADQNGQHESNGPNWTKIEWMAQTILNWIEWTKLDQNDKKKKTELDWIGQNRPL